MKDIMLQNTSNNKGFNSVFSEVQGISSLKIPNNNCLRLFHLEIKNNKFSYLALHSFLQKNIGRYVFSRSTIENYHLEGEAEAIGLKAIELLRTASDPKDNGAGGELGEILLYLFLEQKLHAPKLLSKVELKTSGNQYVFGSDAVHLLKINDKSVPSFQLVLGESKIKGNLKSAVDAAFKSISEAEKKQENEIRLIEKNILAESFDPETTSFIKSLFVPSKRELSINVDNAFGIFLGYSLNIDDFQGNNDDFRTFVTKQMEQDLLAIAPYIEKKITSSGLSGYSFYVYLLPFNDAANDRAAIINKLKGGE